MQGVFNEINGTVELPLQHYHQLYGKIKELQQEITQRDDDSQEVLNQFKRMNDAAKLVEDFLNSLYLDNPTYIGTQVEKFNSSNDSEGLIILDKENKRITVRLPDDDTRTDN